jgi:hypothetical protein
MRIQRFVLFLLLLARFAPVGILSAEEENPRWRWGIGVATQNIVCGTTDVRLAKIPGYRPGDGPFNPMGLGWRFNWGWNEGPRVPGVEYMPLVCGYRPGVHPSAEQIRAAVEADPERFPDGTTWMIGNEIVWDDKRTPEQYAKDYHEIYHILKDINPTWKIANGSVITSVTYAREQWSGTAWELLDQVRDSYREQHGEDWPVDVWNIHPYIWRKKNGPDSVEEQLERFGNELVQMRRWMKKNGYGDKPLIITEYGLLEKHDWDWMVEFLLGSFDILEEEGHPDGLESDNGHLVQRWAWFVMNDHVWKCDGPRIWPHCCLYDPTDWSMTPLGEAFYRRAVEDGRAGP